MINFKKLILNEMARSNVELNPKSTIVEDLEPYKDRSDVFVSFTIIDKLGVNPINEYNTPYGIYAYPIGAIWDNIKNYNIPFAGERPYAWVIEPSDQDGEFLYDTSKYKEDDYINDIKKLREMLKSDFDEDVFNVLVHKSEANARHKSPFGKLWNVTRNISFELPGERDIMAIWSQLFRALGYSGVANIKDEGIIHINEPSQAIFFTIKALKIIKQSINYATVESRKLKANPEVMHRYIEMGNIIPHEIIRAIDPELISYYIDDFTEDKKKILVMRSVLKYIVKELKNGENVSNLIDYMSMLKDITNDSDKLGASLLRIILNNIKTPKIYSELLDFYLNYDSIEQSPYMLTNEKLLDYILKQDNIDDFGDLIVKVLDSVGIEMLSTEVLERYLELLVYSDMEVPEEIVNAVSPSALASYVENKIITTGDIDIPENIIKKVYDALGDDFLKRFDDDYNVWVIYALPKKYPNIIQPSEIDEDEVEVEVEDEDEDEDDLIKNAIQVAWENDWSPEDIEMLRKLPNIDSDIVYFIDDMKPEDIEFIYTYGKSPWQRSAIMVALESEDPDAKTLANYDFSEERWKRIKILLHNYSVEEALKMA